MRKVLIGLSAGMMAVLLGTVSAFAAGIGFGFSGNVVEVTASGSESSGTTGSETDTSTVKANVSESSFIGSYYLEVTLGETNGWALGYEAIPGSADVTDKTHQRVDTETSVTGSAAVSNTRTFKANAQVDDYKVVYAEVPLGPFYVRAGISEITVNTQETASGNGGSYGNATLDGTLLGFGIKGVVKEKIRWKLGYEVNDFDTLSLTSTGNSVAAETNVLSADLDTKTVKFGIGLQF